MFQHFTHFEYEFVIWNSPMKSLATNIRISHSWNIKYFFFFFIIELAQFEQFQLFLKACSLILSSLESMALSPLTFRGHDQANRSIMNILTQQSNSLKQHGASDNNSI